MTRRAFRPTCAAAFAVLLSTAAAAQSVRGTVTEQGSAAPASGALVSLLDARDGRAAQTVADSAGRFRLRAPGAGAYRVRVERVGGRAVTSPAFALEAGAERVVALRVPPASVALDGIVAEAAPRCGPLPAGGADVARVWAEARTALLSTVRAAADSLVEFDFTTYERATDLAGREIGRPVERRRRFVGAMPFASRPAEELEARGYARIGPELARVGTQRLGREMEWYGPDADVLLSDRFLDGHCFYLRPGTGGDAGRLGLAFEPVRGRRIPDVRGVLWVDAATAELRRLEFGYTGVSWPGVETLAGTGGDVEFARLPSGVWIVRAWELRGTDAREPIRARDGALTLRRPGQRIIVGGRVDAHRPFSADRPEEETPPAQVEEIILPVS